MNEEQTTDVTRFGSFQRPRSINMLTAFTKSRS